MIFSLTLARSQSNTRTTPVHPSRLAESMTPVSIPGNPNSPTTGMQSKSIASSSRQPKLEVTLKRHSNSSGAISSLVLRCIHQFTPSASCISPLPSFFPRSLIQNSYVLKLTCRQPHFQPAGPFYPLERQAD